MHSHIGCICFEFSSVHVFKYVLNPLGSEQPVSLVCRPQLAGRPSIDMRSRHIHTGCICLIFSTVCFHLCPQIAGPKGSKDALVAFVLTYLHCVFKNESSNVIYRENTESHWLHLFDFSPLCVFKCLLKLLA